MGRIFEKRGKLWLDFVDEFGKRRRKSTSFSVGDEKLAEELLRRAEAGIEGRKKTIVNGGPMTVEHYARRWIEERKSNSGSHTNRLGYINFHIVPILGAIVLGDLRPRHIISWIKQLERTPSKKGGYLSPGSINAMYATLRLMLRDAVIDELIIASPCVLGKQYLPPRVDKDYTWRSGAVYSRDEVQALISDERIAFNRRVYHAIAFLAGLRYGEIIGLTWDDYDRQVKPLGMITVNKAWSHHEKRVKPPKTKVPRRVPVHPELAAVLAEWRLAGWEAYVGRAPRHDDLICPNIFVRAHRVTSTDRKWLIRELKILGLRPRRGHDARRTFISLAIADGARPEILRWITHGVQMSSVMDEYTTIPWPTLCEAVSCLKLSRITGELVTAKMSLAPRWHHPASMTES